MYRSWGYLGLTPQSVHKLGGYVVQGRGEEKASKLVADARALEAAGCYALVLEAIPAALAIEITRAVSIPTIGIGAGAGCDGQVLVSYDLLGMNPDFSPKFVKRYADLAGVITEAVTRYCDEVRSGAFPSLEHSFSSEKPAEKKPSEKKDENAAVLPISHLNGANQAANQNANSGKPAPAADESSLKMYSAVEPRR